MSLIDEIKKNPDIRKILGKREIEIVEKQVLGVKLTPSERTRLSRDIRKKFQAIKKLCLYENQLELKQGSEIKRIVDDVKSEIVKDKRVKGIYLFGSSVDGTRRINSDIDIAVEFDKITNKESVLFRKEMIVDQKVQISVYNTLPKKIKEEIENKGRIIWKKE